MNPLPDKTRNGTIGEVIAQLYLLALGVQAAPPLRDSGNDLIACKGNEIRALQIKTKLKHSFSKHNLPEKYHAVIFIVLGIQGSPLIERIKSPTIYLLTRTELEDQNTRLGKNGLKGFILSQERVDFVFEETRTAGDAPQRGGRLVSSVVADDEY